MGFGGHCAQSLRGGFRWLIADFFSAERVSCVIACFDGLFVDLALRFGLWVKQWLFALREKNNKKKDYDYDYDYYREHSKAPS